MRLIGNMEDNRPMVNSRVSMAALNSVKDTYALMNSNDWNKYRDLKMQNRQYTDIEKEYLNKADEVLANGKLYLKELMKPGNIVSTLIRRNTRHLTRIFTD